MSLSAAPVLLVGAAALLLAACGGGGGSGPPPAGTGTPPPELPAGVPGVAAGWGTDWAKTSIDLTELVVGIARPDPRDVIPPLDSPAFESVAEASAWLAEREPVVLLELEGEARAYPLQILTWHEIVNDQAGDVPIAVTYCPLCNSAVAFDRRVSGRTLRFGTSGLLRNSDLVMWDRETESLWQQITGEAIVGDLTGTRLEFVPASIVRWSEFREQFPQGRVLSRETGSQRAYGTNPYVRYDSSGERPFLFTGELDERYPPLERVVGLTVGRSDKAYPFAVIAAERAVNDVVGGVPVVVLWGAADAASPLDSADIAQGRGVGVGVAYLRTVDGRVLTFEPRGEDAFADRETGSTWDLLGRAVSGPLAGARLAPALHANHFWFAWAAFNPEAPVYAGAGAPGS